MAKKVLEINKMLYELGVHIVFLNEPLVNISVFDSTRNNLFSVDIKTDKHTTEFGGTLTSSKR